MSLFQRPTWAKTEPEDGEEATEVNIFNHAERSYRDIVQEQERRKKEKLERKRVKEKRRASEKRVVKDQPGASGSNKKRRITQEDGEALLKSVGISNVVDLSDTEDVQPFIFDEDVPVRRSPRVNKQRDVASPRKRPPPSTQVIELGSDDDNVDEEKMTQEPPVAEPEEEDEESDSEFAELARKARAQQRQRELLSKQASISRPSPGIGTSKSADQSIGEPPADPVVQILIDSRIPNTNPLIVARKFSQRVQEVRKVWCQRQGFGEAQAAGIFLIHRGRKIYDATTCRSLGLYIDDFGHVAMKGAEGQEGADKVHLQAVTEEIYREMKAEKERDAKRRSGELDEETQEAKEEEEAPKQIRLILKAKATKDFKLVVKPHTPFSKIVNAYCKTHELDDTHTVHLEFDGERLDPDDTVESTEISDYDCVNVHISKTS